jgi:MFS family permease
MRSGRLPLAVIVTLAVAAMSPMLLLGAHGPLIREELRMTSAELGLSVACFFVGSALAAIPAGRLATTPHPAIAARYGLTCSVASLLGLALAANHPMDLALLLGLGGIGNALGQISLNQLIARAIDHRRQGLAYGLKQSAVPVAALMAGLLVATVGVNIGWRFSFGIVAIGSLPLLFVRLPDTGGAHTVPSHARWLRPTKPLLVLTAGGVLAAMVITAMPTFLTDWATSEGWSQESAGLLLAVGSLAGIVTRVAIGWWADRAEVSAFSVASVLLIIGSCGLGLLSLPGSLLMLGGTLIAFSGAWAWPGLVWLGLARNDPASPARAMAIFSTGPYVGGILGPMAVGWVSNNWSYGAAWSGLMLAGFVAALAFLAGGRSLRQTALVRRSLPSRGWD